MATFVTAQGTELPATILENGVLLVSDERQTQAADYGGAEANVNSDGYVEFGPYARVLVEGRNKNSQVLAYEGDGAILDDNDIINADGTVTRVS